MAALSPTFCVALMRVKVWKLLDLCKWCWKGGFAFETGFSHLGLRLISLLNLLEGVCPRSFAQFYA